MYCQNCGTVNQSGLEKCAKCGHELRKQDKVSEVDMALAARAQVKKHGGSSSGIPMGLVLGLIVITALILVPIVLMTAQLKNRFPVLTRSTDKPAVDQGPGFGLAPKESPEVINRDAGRKSNALKARNALEQYYSSYDRYPDALSEVDGAVLGFIPDSSYKYEALAGGKDFRLEIALESQIVSGADIMHDDTGTKLVVTGSSR